MQNRRTIKIKQINNVHPAVTVMASFIAASAEAHQLAQCTLFELASIVENFYQVDEMEDTEILLPLLLQLDTAQQQAFLAYPLQYLVDNDDDPSRHPFQFMANVFGFSVAIIDDESFASLFEPEEKEEFEAKANKVIKGSFVIGDTGANTRLNVVSDEQWSCYYRLAIPNEPIVSVSRTPVKINKADDVRNLIQPLIAKICSTAVEDRETKRSAPPASTHRRMLELELKAVEATRSHVLTAPVLLHKEIKVRSEFKRPLSPDENDALYTVENGRTVAQDRVMWVTKQEQITLDETLARELDIVQSSAKCI